MMVYFITPCSAPPCLTLIPDGLHKAVPRGTHTHTGPLTGTVAMTLLPAGSGYRSVHKHDCACMPAHSHARCESGSRSWVNFQAVCANE